LRLKKLADEAEVAEALRYRQEEERIEQERIARE